jgi:phosphoribosylanthranilate isomerase
MKKAMFFENAKLLYDRFGIIPLMYGSLGLEYITNESLNADDIDILIPEAFIGKRWNEFNEFFMSKGYILIDEHEHTFEKNGILYSYASIEELQSFAEIELSEIEQLCNDGIRFKVLSLGQYLKVYRASAKDGYRIEVREKKDHDKIAFIEKKLKINNESTNSNLTKRKIYG